MLILSIILYALISGLLTAYIAGQRGRDITSWYLVGLLTGPLSLIVLLVPKLRHEPDAMFNT